MSAPGSCLLQGVSAPGGVCSVGGVCSGGCLLCTEAAPLAETTTAADGTHTTGMHSCIHLHLKLRVTRTLENTDKHTLYFPHNQ